MQKKIQILGICGSLRKASYNRGLLQAALNELPENCHLELFDLAEIPLFNQDHEMSPPASVSHFKEKIHSVDAILLAGPEYNYSFSGVLKNAIDWGSRPYGKNSWDGKPVAMMGATMGLQGTARAQYHLRQVFVTLNMHSLNHPEVMVSAAQDKFDANGQLTDKTVRQKIKELLVALVALTIDKRPK